MTNTQSLPDGTLSKEEHDWLVLRAAHGFGIITTCCAHVSQDGQGFDGELGIWSDHHIVGLSQLANNIRAHGALSLMQIFHAGMRAPQRLIGTQPVSASVNPTEASATGLTHELSENEIWCVINDFAQAARRVSAAGFDGVELHGAHGYLICQFLSTEHNKRRDSWGGCLENRARFLMEIISATRKVVPSDFLIGVRISPEHKGVVLDDSLKLAAMLSNIGVDFLHLSCWDSFKTASSRPGRKTLTEWFTTSIANLPPIFTAGNIWTPQDAQNVMNMGADMVAVAKCAIGNPDWAQQLVDPAYRPLMPPYSFTHLRKCGLSDKFIHRLWRNYPGFVSSPEEDKYYRAQGA
jgi:2,4-dienoyl-CoA reductase-like NADH-dependent reductase (Old Yellow Enzyme family)